MNNLLAYSGLTTKVRAMQSHLIAPAEYEQITNLSSVTELVGYLQNHPAYYDIFDGVDTADLHRGGLERLLVLSEYKSFAKLYNFSSIRGRRYLKLYFIKYETHLLKQLIREIMDTRSVTLDIESLILYFDRFSDINLRAVAEATTLEEFIESLRGSKYYASLKRVQAISDTTLFDYEICLDLFYFTTVWNGKNKFLTGKDLEVITELYGTTIDLLNIQWLYRAKKYYNISSADIYALIIPINYKLRKSQIKSFVESDSIHSLSDMLQTTYYSDFCAYGNEVSLEQVYKVILDKKHKLSMRHNPYSLASVNNYLYCKHAEITKLITLTECIRYSYTPAEIKKIIE